MISHVAPAFRYMTAPPPPSQRAKESLAKLEGMSSRASREEMKWGAVNPPSKVSQPSPQGQPSVQGLSICLYLALSVCLSLALSVCLSHAISLSLSLSLSPARLLSLSRVTPNATLAGRCRARRDQLEGLHRTETGSSRGHNLGLTVLFVPDSLIRSESASSRARFRRLPPAEGPRP